MNIQTRNSLALDSFSKYCRDNPYERFWQALRNWSKFRFILGANERDGATINTFGIEDLEGTK